MPDKTISEAQSKATLEETDMLPLAAANDDTAYKITGAAAFDSFPAATTALKGRVELATAAEAAEGTDTERVVTPAGLLVRKTGTAILGGDLSGDARGAGACDLQGDRSSATQVASGDGAAALGNKNTAGGAAAVALGVLNAAAGAAASALGYDNTASQANAAAMGYDNTASAAGAMASGVSCTASGAGAAAMGAGCTASGAGASALGVGSVARIANTVNLSAVQVIRKDNNETAGTELQNFCGVEAVIMTKEIDLKIVATQTITLPANLHIYPRIVGIIITSVTSVTGGPTIRAGWTGTADGLLSARAIGAWAKYMHGAWDLDTDSTAIDGHTSVTFSVTAGASATVYKGRFYVRGLVLEDE